MKKRRYLLFFIILFISFILTSCKVKTKHEHKYDNYECSCGDVDYSKGLLYSLKNDKYLVSGIGDCSDDVIVIPKIYNDKQVVGISSYAFKNASIKEVILFDNIKTIGDSSFESCEKLSYIDLSSIISIGENAFYKCKNINKIIISNNLDRVLKNAFSESNIKSVYFDGKIDEWLDIKFEDPSSNMLAYTNDVYIKYNDDYILLEQIDIPLNIFKINKYQFVGLKKLKKIVIPDNIKNIYDGAFLCCENLEEVVIPKDIVIANNVFIGCNNLKRIYYKGSKDDWNKISIAEGNDPLLIENVYFYSEEYIEGNYWYYHEGNIVLWN